jgi:hypothetical protein
VGEFVLGKLAKCMVEGEFQDAEGAEAVRFSHGYFGFIVQAFDHTAGEFLFALSSSGSARCLRKVRIARPVTLGRFAASPRASLDYAVRLRRRRTASTASPANRP